MPASAAEPARLADPVAPAQRSEAALAKVHTRTLADGTPAMSFRHLLEYLATIVRSTMRPKSARPGEATFALNPPLATPVQYFHVFGSTDLDLDQGAVLSTFIS